MSISMTTPEGINSKTIKCIKNAEYYSYIKSGGSAVEQIRIFKKTKYRYSFKLTHIVYKMGKSVVVLLNNRDYKRLTFRTFKASREFFNSLIPVNGIKR